MKTIYHQLITSLQSDADLQLGTMLHTKGSAPQIPGAIALFKKGKVIFGTLGGGLLEVYAQKAAKLASENQLNTLQLVNFDAQIEDPEGAICGGKALFSMDANPTQHLNTYLQLIDALDHQKSGVLCSVYTKISEQNIQIEKIWIEKNTNIPEKILPILNEAQLSISKILDKRKACWVASKLVSTENSSSEVYVLAEPLYPMSQLIIVGAGHIGQALCKIAHWADFETVVLDNREEMTTTARFPDASQLICKSLNEGFASLKITPNTYIVITTQGHRTDMEALLSCIKSDAAYIGVIGSKRKSLLMSQKILTNNWAHQEELNFIHTPIGLEIHSKTVNEIAISIIAELIKVRYELHYTPKRKKVSCIVLAAGKSTRMGEQKLLLPYQKSTIINKVVATTLNSNSSQTLVVIGSHKNEIKKALKGLDIILVTNDQFEEGMLSSVQVGVSAVDASADGMIILLADQPMVSEKIINQLITSFQKTDKGLIIPTYNNKRGHPVLIHSKYKKSIPMLNSAIGLRELFLTNSHDILEITVETDEILKDIDTQDDYKREVIDMNN